MTDLDPMLREAMARVRGPVNTRPSLTDVRRRARRRNRRRMAAVGGALACTGVATTALIIRRDAAGPSSSAIPAETTSPDSPTTTYLPAVAVPTTMYTIQPATITAPMVWDALVSAQCDPSCTGLIVRPPDQAAAAIMPTPEKLGCSADACRALFTYVVWHEIAKAFGFTTVSEMQAANPNVDFSVPPVEGEVVQRMFGTVGTTVPAIDETATTISFFDGVMLIDGGAPTGAMDDAYQHLAGYDRTIVPGSGKTIEQTEVMPIGGNETMAAAVGGLLGVDGLDTWDPSFLATPIQGMVAVVIGPDYFDRVGALVTTSVSATTTTLPATSTTSIG